MDSVVCYCCDGIGSIPVTGVYLETLKTLRRWCARPGRFVVANRDYKQFGCKQPTALNNRLSYLERHGFARSEKFGRQRRFYVA